PRTSTLSLHDALPIYERLGQAGHAFEDAVAPAEQGDEQLLDHLVLAHDDAGELLFDLVKPVLELADGFHVVVGQRVAARLRVRRSEEHTSELQSRFDL